MSQVSTVTTITPYAAFVAANPVTEREMKILQALVGPEYAATNDFTQGSVPSIMLASAPPEGVTALSIFGVIAALVKKQAVLTFKVKGMTMVAVSDLGIAYLEGAK